VNWAPVQSPVPITSCNVNIRVSEWLLFNANSAIFQLYHGVNMLIFNEMMMRSALYYNNTLSWNFIVLAHCNNSPRVEMSLQSDTLFWLRANQSLLFLLNAACLAEKQQIPILQSLVWPERARTHNILHCKYYNKMVLTTYLYKYANCVFIRYYWYSLQGLEPFTIICVSRPIHWMKQESFRLLYHFLLLLFVVIL